MGGVAAALWTGVKLAAPVLLKGAASAAVGGAVAKNQARGSSGPAPAAPTQDLQEPDTSRRRAQRQRAALASQGSGTSGLSTTTTTGKKTLLGQ